MKKLNIKGQKDTQKKKKKGNWQMFNCKGEKVIVFKCTKHIVELIQFGSILLCLNFSIVISPGSM